ncbi:hypothetical protein MTR67_034930, partial [Solanum verrucosum]
MLVYWEMHDLGIIYPNRIEHPLLSSNETGMWECPDFIPVSNVKHVLKVSMFQSQVEYYTIGTYDHDMDIFFPDSGSVDNESGLRLDYGKYYASKSFFDSEKERRILLAWFNESTSASIDIMKGWSGLQEFMVVLFIIFKKNDKFVVLMCSDQK